MSITIQQLISRSGIFVLAVALVSCKDGPKETVSLKDTLSAPQPSVACGPDTPVFSSFVPHEVDVFLANGYQGLTPSTQPCFDVFSWQSFVALNWPANSDGSPVKGSFTDDPQSMRVWEYYTDPAVIFETNEQLLPFTGPVKQGSGLKGLRMFAKLSHELMNVPASIKEATGQPIIDKNLNFALYEIRLNGDEVDYILKDSLFTLEGQQKRTVSFPAGSATGGVGAMEIKATWKILTGADDATKFYHRSAVIYVPANQSASGKPLYLQETVGLVAMHIIHKTTKFPFWVWSTFEHINNAPEQAQVGSAGNQYSFYNPACSSCTENTPVAEPTGGYIWQTTKPYAKAYAVNGQYGTQAVRSNPVYGPTEAVNQTWQKALASAGSVFANYRLIGSQWSVVGETFPADTISAPDTLANTTLETYIQNSSCTMTCHKFAKDAANKGADFSFILGHARSAEYLRKLKSGKK
jgi:hypothetical protein